MRIAAPETAQSFRHRFEGPFWRKVFLAGVRGMSPEVQRRTMPMWAGIFYVLVPRARRIVERNLARVIGPASPVEEKARSFRLFVNYAQSITFAYAAHFGRPLPDTEFSGHEILQPLVERKQGAILLTGHMGCWQIGHYLLKSRDWLPPITMAMAEEPNRKLAAFEAEVRARLRIVYTTSSPFASIELANVLRRGEFVGMQIDRHLGGAHAMLPFFGRPAPFPLGPASLARATRTPLVPVFVLSDDDRRRCRVIVEEPIDVARSRDRDADVHAATARAVAVYESYVRRYPEQWFNFYDFWARADER